MSVTPEPDARSTSARRQEWALVALFWLIPPFAVGGGLTIAPLTAVCGMIAAPWRWARTLAPEAVCVLALALWTAISLAWSPEPRPEQALKNVGAAATGLLLVYGALRVGETGRRLVRASLLAGMLMLVVLLGSEALFDMAFNRAMQPDATTDMLLRNPGRGAFLLQVFGFAALGAALALRNAALRFGLAAALLAGMAALSMQFDMAANALVFAAGGAAFAFAYVAPRLAPIVMGSGLAAWAIAAPWVTLAAREISEHWIPQLPPSWGMRLQIWSYAAERISEQPWIGWGLDASRTFKQEQQLGDIAHAAIPLHPHSFSLQVWLETGLIGAILAAASLAAAGFAASRFAAGDRVAAAVASAGFASLGLAWNISYGAWQEWLMALPFAFAAAVIVMRRA